MAAIDVMHRLRGLDLERYAPAFRAQDVDAVAHEDDAERAVRAGLDVLSAMPRLCTPAGEALQECASGWQPARS